MEATEPITVGIVDDDELVGRSLAVILGASDDIRVAWTATAGEDALRLFAHNAPDVLLLDIRMPEMDGLEVASRIMADTPHARVVFLTTFADDDYIVRALRLGARGYLIKQETGTIAPAIRSVMNGQSVFGSEVCERLDNLMTNALSPSTSSHVLACLTDRERDIIRLVAEGCDNREIAETLYLSEGTVRNHISDMLQKLALKNRTQLAIAYYRID